MSNIKKDHKWLEAKSYTFEELLNEKGYIIYTNVGVSMMPLLRQRRDIIEIRPLQGRAKRYDAVLYKVDDKYILHRVLKVHPHDYVICGDHNIQREYGITDDQILGVMIRVIRDGKSIYPTDWKYKLYVHLWCDFFPIRAAILAGKMLAGAAFRKLKKMIRPAAGHDGGKEA